MKHQFSIVRPTIQRPDIAIAKLGIVASLALLGLRLVASQVLLLVIPLAIGTGSLLYLVTDRSRATHARPALSNRVLGFAPAAVFLGLAVLVATVYAVGARTDLVYLLTGVIGTAIVAQILLVDADRLAVGPVLLQILAAAVVIRLTALFVTPGYVGVDIWTHATSFTAGIASEGSLGALAGTKYAMAPLYHVTAGIGALVFGSVRTGLYLSLGLLVALSALFVYATGAIMMPARWALLATALYAFSDQFIRWGMHLIPTSLGLALFLGAVYLITRVFAGNGEGWAVGLLLVSSLAIVFTHQVSTAIVLFVLAIATAVAAVARLAEPRSAVDEDRSARLAARSRTALSLAGVFVLTLATTIVSWANTPFGDGDTFLWKELEVLQSSLAENAGFLNLAGGDATTITTASPTSTLGQLAPYIELVGFGLLLAGAVVGGLGMLRWDVPRDLSLTHLVAGAGLFLAVFGFSLFGIRALLPGRWLAFLYVPMALIGAVGVYYISQTGSYRLIAVVFLLLAIGYPTTMVVAEKATLDNPAFDEQHKRFAYTTAEIGAIDRIERIHPAGTAGEVGTDHPYVTLFRRVGGYEAETLTLGTDGPVGADASVYRSYQSTGPSTFRRGEGASRTIQGPVGQRVCPDSWNKRYANDEVWFCVEPEVEP
jgi:hypothetical protein